MSKVPWRFGDRPEDAEAWLRNPVLLHIVVDFQSPRTPPGQWHRIMTVTSAWLRREASATQSGGVWRALLIVPDGSRQVIEASITQQLETLWPLLVRYAVLLPSDYEPAEM